METEQTIKGPRERRFERWVNIVGGIYLFSAMAIVLLVPYKIRGGIFFPSLLILCGLIAYKNRRVREIRQEEQTR